MNKNIENSNISIFKSNIVLFELEEFNKNDLISCILHHYNYTSENCRECQISIKSICDLKLHFVHDGCSIYHYKVYKDGFGNKVLEAVEGALKEIDCNNLHIWIGTDEGKEKTRKFLKKNNFSNIYTEEDEAHGLTFHGEKELL